MSEAEAQRVHRDDVDRVWRAASVELTTHLRLLGRAAALTDVDEQTLRAVTDKAKDLVKQLERRLRTGVLLGDFDQESTSANEVRRIGDHNVRVVPMEIRIDGDCAKAHHRPSELAEGAPGLLHGGYAAWLVDCMCGLLVEEKGGSAPRTASLTLNYRAPTPIGSELLLRSAIEQREGRKLWVTTTIEAEGVVTVEARGLFITRQD